MSRRRVGVAEPTVVSNCLPEHNRYSPGLCAWVGFRQESFEVSRRARPGDRSRVGFVGLLGEYVARIYSEVKRRPHFIIRERY